MLFDALLFAVFFFDAMFTSVISISISFRPEGIIKSLGIVCVNCIVNPFKKAISLNNSAPIEGSKPKDAENLLFSAMFNS